MPSPPLKRRTRRAGFRLGDLELTKQGVSRYDWRDPYHMAVTLPWPLFFAIVLATDLAINLVFASLYRLRPGCVSNANSFTDAFFFSIETLATVGYGTMAPASTYGHVVATVEILCGLTFTAIMTGLIFVRFSRPRARILFAEHAVIARHRGKPALMIRLGNGRMNVLTDAAARLTLIMADREVNDRQARTIYDLRLERPRMPLFALTWTLVHVLDDASPLAGLDRETLLGAEAHLFVTVEVRDVALGAVVHDLKEYSGDGILFGMRYQDAISFDERGRANADLRRLSAVEPDS